MLGRTPVNFVVGKDVEMDERLGAGGIFQMIKISDQRTARSAALTDKVSPVGCSAKYTKEM
jgi:hypothetical protein